MIILLLIATSFADIIVKPPYAVFPVKDSFTPTNVPVPVKVDGLLIHDQSLTYYGYNWVMCSPYFTPIQRFKQCQIASELIGDEAYSPTTVSKDMFSFYGANFHDDLNWNFSLPFLRPNFSEIIYFEGESNRVFAPSIALNRSMVKFYKSFYHLVTFYGEGLYISNNKKAIIWGNTMTSPNQRVYLPGTKLASFCFTVPIYKEPTVKLTLSVDGKPIRQIFSANTTRYICESFVFNGTNVTISLNKGKVITQYGVSSGYYLFQDPLKTPRTLHIIPQCDGQTPHICQAQVRSCNATANCLIHSLGPFPFGVPDPTIIENFYNYLVLSLKDSIYCIYKKIQYENYECNFFSQYYTPFLSPSNHSIWVREEGGQTISLQSFNKILDLSRYWDYFTIDSKTFNFYEPLIQNLLDQGFNWVGGYLVKPDSSPLGSSIETTWKGELNMSPGILYGMVFLCIFLFFICCFSFCCNQRLQKIRRS